MAQIKGTAIRGLLKRVKETGYAGGIPAILAELPPASLKTFDHRILASGWYPYDSYGDLLTVVHRRLHGERDDALVELGRWLAKQDAGTTLKIFALFASVETMLQRGPFFWPRHCDTGVFETVDVQKGSGVGVLRDFPGVHPLHCRLLAGWVEGMAVVAGAHTVRSEKVKCVHRGDAWCEYRGSWT